MEYDIGIIGAGTAGCSAAIDLARSGHEVTIYEAVEDPEPVGAGLLIQPTGQAALHRLGAAGPIFDAGARARRCRWRRCSGVCGPMKLTRFATGDWLPGNPTSVS